MTSGLYMFLLSCVIFHLGESTETNITNGSDEYSYLVGVITVNGLGLATKECTGTVIDQYWVLTAAHCFAWKMFAYATVKHKSKGKGERSIDTTIFKHPNAEIALLKLKFPIDVTPVKLPEAGRQLAIGNEVTVRGWKRIVGENLKVTDSKPCLGWLNFGAPPEIICLANKGAQACEGDDGGPLLLDHVQYGVTTSNPAFPPMLKSCWEPTVFIPVWKYLSWIEETMHNNLPLPASVTFQVLPAALILLCQVVNNEFYLGIHSYIDFEVCLVFGIVLLPIQCRSLVATKMKIFLLVLCLVGLSLQDTDDNEVEIESPLKEAASDIKKEQHLDNLGGILNSFVQNGGAKKILEGVLQNPGGAGGILDALASLANQNQDNSNDDSGDDLWKGLGGLASLVGAFQGGNNGNGGANPLSLLQGLGSLLSNAGNNKKGMEPDILSSLAGMFSEEPEKKPSKKKTSKEKGIKKYEKKKAKKEENNDFDLGDMMSMASSFMGDSGRNLFDKSLSDILPMIMQTFSAFVGPDAEERAESHASHAEFMPTIIEKAHLFFDHFLHSELGKNLLATLGADKTFKVFLDENGRFSYDKFVDLIENQSFRKHWIERVTIRIIHLIQGFTKQMNFLSYLETGRNMANGFFKSQGFPEKVLLDSRNPVDSISSFVDYFSKVFLDITFVSKPYVEPAVQYMKDVYIMANDSLGSHREPKELSNKLADTINLDIIEPIIRVNRAYRFAKKYPKCDRYVFCTINQAPPTGDETLPGLKKLLTRANSVILGWFLTSHTQSTFWELYEDITTKKNCKDFYTTECGGFHDEEMKVTTEYIHNEL